MWYEKADHTHRMGDVCQRHVSGTPTLSVGWLSYYQPLASGFIFQNINVVFQKSFSDGREKFSILYFGDMKMVDTSRNGEMGYFLTLMGTLL